MSRTTAEIPLEVAASQLGNASMKGYLEKKRPSKKLLSVKYQRRWCLVYGNYFFYYDTPDDKSQKGSFSLEGYRFLACPGHSQWGFSLVSQHKRPFEFMAPNRDDYLNWEKAIKKGISLTRRRTEPIKPKEVKPVKIDHKVSVRTENIGKSSTLPNLDTHSRPKLSTGTFKNSPTTLVQKTEVVVTRSNSSDNLSQRMIQDETSFEKEENDPKNNDKNIEYSRRNASITKDSLDDSDSDDNGYIKTTKLNFPQRPVKHIVNKAVVVERKSYTEDDYMKVLPDLLPVKKEDSPYMVVHSDPNHNDKLEKIYSSVKRPKLGIQYRSDSDYASVETSHQKKEQSPVSESESSNEEDDDEDDYVNPHDIVQYRSRSTKIEKLIARLSADYERVDEILPQRLQKQSSSSSSDSDESDDYTKVDEYKSDEQKLVHDQSIHSIDSHQLIINEMKERARKTNTVHSVRSNIEDETDSDLSTSETPDRTSREIDPIYENCYNH